VLLGLFAAFRRYRPAREPHLMGAVPVVDQGLAGAANGVQSAWLCLGGGEDRLAEPVVRPADAAHDEHGKGSRDDRQNAGNGEEAIVGGE
jgi:hypothetical protein